MRCICNPDLKTSESVSVPLALAESRVAPAHRLLAQLYRSGHVAMLLMLGNLCQCASRVGAGITSRYQVSLSPTNTETIAARLAV
jgi:hypothetical protein